MSHPVIDSFFMGWREYIIVFFSEISKIFFDLRMSYSSLEVFIKCLMDFNTAQGWGGRERGLGFFLLKN